MFAACLVSASALAQIGPPTGRPLVVQPPEREFATSDAHYQYLLEQGANPNWIGWTLSPRLFI